MDRYSSLPEVMWWLQTALVPKPGSWFSQVRTLILINVFCFVKLQVKPKRDKLFSKEIKYTDTVQIYLSLSLLHPGLFYASTLVFDYIPGVKAFGRPSTQHRSALSTALACTV